MLGAPSNVQKAYFAAIRCDWLIFFVNRPKLFFDVMAASVRTAAAAAHPTIGTAVNRNTLFPKFVQQLQRIFSNYFQNKIFPNLRPIR